MSALLDNYRAVLENIAASCASAGREPKAVKLVAVSKGHSTEKILELYSEGHRDFGESYVQELVQKADLLPDDIRWHFIGHLQSRKAKSMTGLTYMIHSVDRESVAHAISKRSARNTNVLFQVNIGDEPQKHGAATEDALATFLQLLENEKLRFRGLMAIPPVADAATTRAHFQAVAKMMKVFREAIAETDPERALDFSHLSIGMTNDYPIAIEEGATLVRVGTAIFGPRDYT